MVSFIGNNMHRKLIIIGQLVLILGGFLWHSTNGQLDFQFDANTDDDLQVVFTEPIDVVVTNQSQITPYEQDISSCPSTEKKLILSLVLRTNNWDDILNTKKDRAIRKLSNFFAIPKEYISADNVYKRNIQEMSKYAVSKGINRLGSYKKLGQISFTIGCGTKYFATGQLVANQLAHQINDGSLNDISGLDFGWWAIWQKHSATRTPRNRRDLTSDKEGSGEDYDDYYDDNDDDETITEIPSVEHPHRHHHGDDKYEMEETTIPTITQTLPTIVVTTIPIPSSSSPLPLPSPSPSTSPSPSPLSPQQQQHQPPITTKEDVHAKNSVTTVIISTSTKFPNEPIAEVVTERKTPDTAFVTTSEKARLETTTPKDELITDSDEYDETDYDDYDDEFKNVVRTSKASSPTPTIVPNITVPVIVSTQINTTPSTTPAPTTPITTTEKMTTTEYVEPEPINYPPIIKLRLPKQPVTAGKPFSYIVPLETFFDNEDGTNLKLELLDKNDNPLKANSWLQFNSKTREIYGLPLEDAVSKWQFKLRATDSANDSVIETVDIAVQQHKAHRSANHEISIGIKLNEKFPSNIDWQIQLIRGIIEVLGDNSMSSVVVREVRHSIQDVNAATFIYTNETLPKDKCPEEKLDELFQRLTVENLSKSVAPDISVKSVSGKPIGPCLKIESPKSKLPKPTPHTTKNYPPVPRNQVDRVNATVGHLLIFKVPSDTFYDPEDNTDLKLSLLSRDRTPLDSKHWLQFDSKNQEFYGIPMASDAGQKEYLLVAEDREGKSATDALVVVVSYPVHREYNTIFEMSLGMPYDEFDNAAVQRRFIERVAQVFGDATTSNIQVKSHHKIHQSGKTLINYYNTTLHRTHNVCPNENIEQLKRILVQQDGKVRHRVKDTIGNEFDLLKVTFTPVGACSEIEERISHAAIPIKPDDSSSSSFKDDYLLTFVLPAVIIVIMILLAAIIACVLHRRRMTGKMELGDEEERRSFRSRGIPVIFQDELEEKPEIGNKSPVILKDEKPPLLPPSYNSTNPEDNEDCDEYVPPPAVVINGRESRGKSPVTPSYRKPPPYVSP